MATTAEQNKQPKKTKMADYLKNDHSGQKQLNVATEKTWL